MKNIIYSVLFTFTFIGWVNAQATNGSDIQYFGDKITDKDAKSVASAFAELEKTKVVEPIKLKGTVQSVCLKKGCWMTLAEDNAPEEKSVFVQFKDYGFFVPKDISGRTVVIEGKLYKEVTTVEDLKHFAEDKGASKDELAKITEPKVEIKFLASGVLLYPQS